MKLDNINGSSNPTLGGTSSVRSNRSASNVTQSSTSSSVQLSEKALEAQSNSEVFDSEKVAQIKAAIAEGRFQVNADAVADSLLRTARDLVQAQSRTA